ncbi:TIR domain-containing protein [Sphingomonas sp. PsM26]|nr:TIR domain-containing protein [Sphingomonas sp. PsM26]
MDEKALIFLSYASPDYDRVHEYFAALTSDGLDPWLDKEKLVAGQNWDFEIKRALARAVIIVVFLSENSVSRRGYVQREIKIALGQSEAKLHDDIYLIPVMLDEVIIPPQLQDIQVIGASTEDSYKQLSRAIDAQLKRLDLENARLQGDPQLRWNMIWHRDKWEGLPGYDTSYQVPRFYSEENPQASEITDVIRGWAAAEAMEQRSIKFCQSPDFCNFGQPQYRRMNSWEASCGAPIVQEGVVSISYAIHWMGAGAAHPNMHFKTFAFTINPTTNIASLQSIFEDDSSALLVLQQTIRHQLLYENERFTEEGSDEPALPKEWVESGTDKWSDIENYIFKEDGIDFLFPPYQVAAYVYGPQFATVPYERVAKFMHKHYAFALGVEYLQHERSWTATPIAMSGTIEDSTSEGGPDETLSNKASLDLSSE